jgi:hypothetical protein|tara:strand:- start:5264 stop:6298 length:1035 start_codon:yes stop_codon:yes gene_type:complete
MEIEMSKRILVFFAVFCAFAADGVVSTAAAQNRSPNAGDWEVPRTADGHPDLQGNWTNATLTPFTRRLDTPPIYTWEEVAELEQTDGDCPAAPGTAACGRASFGLAGQEYNEVYWDRGSRVAIINGEPRASLVTNPVDGRVPSMTSEAQAARAEYVEFRRQFAQYDHPEMRPLAERCLVSFGSNAGPPMLPNGGYNNNYTIVQTADHVLIMAEMVHDARVIKIGDGPRLPPHVRPWMGDSWGHWEGDVLVVETTNIHPLQRFRGNSSENLKVIERFSRIDQETVLYEFTIDDPTVYTATWGGEVPMMRFDDKLYEYACQEGNYSLAGVLSGARYQERIEAQGGN